MSSENDEQSSPQSPIGPSAPESFPKKQIVRYTRDFLLSFSGLDVCKKLPDGFDKSFLSDLEEAAVTTFERQRTGGSLSLQGSRRGEYSSQSLNRADVSIGYTRGSAGRWEVRSSGSSEREGDFQPEWESSTHDTGKRFGSQSRRTWQNSEHDGLLGSGAFARPSGYPGAQALRSRGDVQLSRSTEPYQPPRPYKAVAYSRKDSNDLCNDETFGSTESSSEDRVEEERKRRESFELMRKEQRKALQEKHKDVHKGNLDADIIALLENSDADKCTKNRCKVDEPPVSSVCQTSSSVSSSNLVPVVRPLVPPGFGTLQVEKNHSVRSASVDKNSILLSTECDQGMNLPINKQKGMPASTADENDCSSAPSSVESVIACNNFSLNATALQEVHKVQEVGIQNEAFPEKMEGCDTGTVVSEEHSSSILGKLFGNAMAKNSDSLANDVQNHINGADVAPWTHGQSGSSKFFHLFHEEIEEKKAIEEKSSRDLLHLIVSDDNLNSQVCISSKDEVAKQLNATQHSENFATTHISTVASSIAGVPADSHRSDDKQNLSCVLTCEDLEQSILAVVKESSSGTHSMQEPRTAFDGKFEEHKDNVDDHASQHLLSLLQRGVNSKETRSSPRLDASESDELLAFSDAEASLGLQISDNIAMKISEEHNSDKRLTLEALFGTAFMNELHSTEAPVSTHRALVGRVSDSGAIQSHELPLYPSDCQSNTFNGQHSNQAILQAEVLQLSKATEHTVSHKNAVNFAGYSDSGRHGFDLGDVAFEGAAGDIRLPEEDSLISLNDSLDPMASGSFHLNKENRNVPLVHEKTVEDHSSSNLLHSFFRDGERSREYAMDYRPLMHASHEMVEVGRPFIHPHGRQSPQFAQQMNHGRPMLAAHLDHQTFRNPHIFLRHDAMHHDPRHHFAQNVFDHPVYNNIRGSQFDPFVHHPLLQSNPVAGNFLQQNSVQGLPRAPISQLNHAPAMSHEINNLQAFQLHHRRPNNYGGPGVGTPGLVAGGAGRPTTEVLERLFEREMRANSKQFHPAMAGHVSELDINSRYL